MPARVGIANELGKKIPKPGDFNNVFRGQDSAYERLLRRGVYLVQMTLGRGFCHELPDAFVEGAVDQQISVGMTGLLETLGIERRPLFQNGWRIEIDLNVIGCHDASRQ